MSGSFTDQGQLDIARSLIIVCVGKKRSGKSVMALTLFRSYPRDRVVIDVAGDDGPAGPDVITYHGRVEDLPDRWPEHRRDDKRPMTLRYVPDSGSPTFLADIDKFIGLAWNHGDCALMIHETGVVAQANRTPANMRRVLMHNRHHLVTLILAMPRPQTVDPLVVAQADVIYIFELPNRRDRQRLAETMGWETEELAEALDQLGPHEYLRYDANEPPPEPGAEHDDRLVVYPALPAQLVKATEAWAFPDGSRPNRRRQVSPAPARA